MRTTKLPPTRLRRPAFRAPNRAPLLREELPLSRPSLIGQDWFETNPLYR